jgi:hypothetical protein
MQVPEYKSFSEFPDTVKGWEAWVQQCKEWSEYREWMRKRRFHALPEDKGIPVPHTGYSKRRKCKNGSGVSASSRVLSHYYADEGEKGSYVRKLVRNRERALWLSEWQEEQNEDAEYGYARDTYSAGEWFSDDPYMWDWYYGEDSHGYCETCNGPCDL